VRHLELSLGRFTALPASAYDGAPMKAPVAPRQAHPAMSSWASTPGVRRSMQSNRPRNTAPEIALRSALHRAGMRFWKHRRPIQGVRCEPDVVFPRIRLAVFVDGCFWHSCPDHATRPVANGDWWARKLEGNVARDRRNTETLQAAGWTVLRIWEHVPSPKAVEEIEVTAFRLRAAMMPSLRVTR
jgi:DNA mismatch endonuclease (patch repair protein)